MKVKGDLNYEVACTNFCMQYMFPLCYWTAPMSENEIKMFTTICSYKQQTTTSSTWSAINHWTCRGLWNDFLMIIFTYNHIQCCIQCAFYVRESIKPKIHCQSNKRQCGSQSDSKTFQRVILGVSTRDSSMEIYYWT
jgi:hypothetical protein